MITRVIYSPGKQRSPRIGGLEPGGIMTQRLKRL
jgi:hypothetical protein